MHIGANRPLTSPDAARRAAADGQGQGRETLLLRRAIRDLLALSTLPAAWVGREPEAIARGVADVLVSALRVDCAYLSLNLGEQSIEAMHGEVAPEVTSALRARCASNRPKAPVVETMAGGYRAAFVPVGVVSKIGVVAAVSAQADFPTEIDSMLLSVAANQAAVSLEAARLLAERTRAEQALRESEAFSRTIIDSSSDCIKVLSFDGEVMYVSPGGERLLECDASELIGKTWTDFWQGTDHDAAMAAVGAARAGGLGSMQGFSRTAKGTPKWWDVVVTPIYGTRGEVDRLLCTSRDVTEQRHIRQALVERDERLRVALAASQTGTFRWDVRDNTVWWDDSLHMLFGAEPGTVHTLQDFMRLVHQEDVPLVREAVARSEKAGSDFEAEFRVPLPNGDVRWLLDKGKMFFDESGAPLYMTGACIDITERKRFEQAERLQGKVIETIAKNATAALFMMDAERHCTYMNPAAERMTGYTASEIKQGEAIGLTLHELVHHSHPDGTRFDVEDCPVFSALPAGERLVSYETHFVRKDGTFYPVLCSASPIIEDGKPVGTVMEVRDLTAQKKAEEMLRNSEKLAATGRLAATIAHEINNPLESVTNLIFLAKCHRDLPAQVKQDLETADQELARVTHIAQQTLGFYRDSSRRGRVVLDDIVKGVVALYGRKLAYKNLKVRTEVKEGVAINGFAGEIRQVVSNLLINAVDAAPVGSSIRIRVSLVSEACGSERMVRITVADHGPGIPVENRAKVFQPFFTTKRDVGTGLGLWVTKAMIDRHGGSIRFRSSTTPPGTGTVFSVLLPQFSESTKSVAA